MGNRTIDKDNPYPSELSIHSPKTYNILTTHEHETVCTCVETCTYAAIICTQMKITDPELELYLIIYKTLYIHYIYTILLS